MAGKFELKRSKSGQFMFNLKAGNHQVILTSELYREKAGAQNGIESVKKHAGDDANYERKTSRKGEPYFVLKATNRSLEKVKCIHLPREWKEAVLLSKLMHPKPQW